MYAAIRIGIGLAVPLAAAHWAFEPVKRVEPPTVRRISAVRNPVDNFVLARLEKEGLTLSAEAPPATLLRRLYLDLTGLPPTLQQQRHFLDDKSPGAYERQVEALLKSPHYGEKWGRYWLDLARYADSDGFRADRFRPYSWRFRDWVIDAFNRDMPFDRFTIEQIAGDLVPSPMVDQRIATGFHRNTLTNREGGTDPEQFRMEQVIDRANTTGTVWLGLTLGCAQCHDHKYDPVSQHDYYRFLAFFNTSDELNADAPIPGEAGPHYAARPAYDTERQRLHAAKDVPGLMSEWERKMIEAAAHPGRWLDWDHAFDDLRTDLEDGERILRTPSASRTRRQTKLITDYFLANYHRVITRARREELNFEGLRKSLAELDKRLPPLSEAPMLALSSVKRETHVLERGDYKSPRDSVEPGVPAVLPPLDTAAVRPGRLDLARWLVSPANPLTARVMVNRLWQEYFGVGLVRTSDNFGLQGEAPTHPQLLDWLASEFVQSGWSLKAIHRIIVTSATYRQSSHRSGAVTSRDPDNRLLSRQGRFRLAAELIRDSALHASGLLNPEIGGPSIRPPQPAGAAKINWVESEGSERYRRGMYVDLRRTAPYTLLANFDAPNGYRSVCVRGRSNTPLQALQLLNDPLFFEAAQALAARTAGVESPTPAARLANMFRITLARSPEATETEWLLAHFESQKRHFAADRPAASQVFPADPTAENAAWATVASVLLNLDEFLTRE